MTSLSWVRREEHLKNLDLVLSRIWDADVG